MARGDRFEGPRLEQGVDVAFLLRPHFHHPLWGGLTREAYAQRRADASAGFVSYLGIVPLALAGLAVVRRARGSGLWAGIFVGSLVLSLGAHLRFEGRLVEAITLPFALLEHVPILSLLRTANRFLIPGSLALAVLAALGFAALRRRTDARFALVLGLVALDFLWLPYPLRDDPLSPLYARLRDGGPPGAVLDIPFTANAATVENMRAQTVHQRPIAGGFVSVPDRESVLSIAREPALADLFGFAPKLARPLDRERLVALGFGVAVLHGDRRDGRASQLREGLRRGDLFAARIAGRLGGMSDASFRAVRARLEEACGPPFYEDESVAAFDLARRP
jgi:hypothetical protein